LAVELKLEWVQERVGRRVGAPTLMKAQAAACSQQKRRPVHVVSPEGGSICGPHWRGWEVARNNYFLMHRLVVECQAGLESFNHTGIV
jgi:hypothetical protein